MADACAYIHIFTITTSHNNYHQVSGTAMGSKLAPSYTNNIMSRFERLHVYTYPSWLILWKGFTDAMVWQLVAHLNTVHPTIKFTSEIPSHQIVILDLMIYGKKANYILGYTPNPLTETWIWTIIQNIHTVWRNPYFVCSSSDLRKFIQIHYICWNVKYICIPRSQLWSPKIKDIEGNTPIMFIITYNRANPNFKDITLKH